uniref:Uncharacterized protein n=2 Tax=Plectus sambesii TaxID=2011161 RepID=A0A914V3R1_9BILA
MSAGERGTVDDCRLTVSVLRGGVRWLWWWWSLPSRGPSTQQTRLVGKAFAGAAPRPSRHYRSFDESTSSPLRRPPARAAAGLRRRRTYASGARAGGRSVGTRSARRPRPRVGNKGGRGGLAPSTRSARPVARLLCDCRAARIPVDRPTLRREEERETAAQAHLTSTASSLSGRPVVDVSQPTSPPRACSTSPDAIGDDALTARVSSLRTEPSSLARSPSPPAGTDAARRITKLFAHRRTTEYTFDFCVRKPSALWQQEKAERRRVRMSSNRPWRRRNDNNGSGGGGGWNGNNRGRWNRQRNRNQHHQQNHDATDFQYSDLPGLVWDEQRGRYFRIQPDIPGSSTGYSRSEMAWEHREQERLALFSSNRDLSSSDVIPSDHQPLPSLIHQQQLGLSRGLQMKRKIAESRLKTAQSQPTYTTKVLPDGNDRLTGCQFIESSRDGKTIVGCWAIGNWYTAGRRQGSRIMCLDVRRSPAAKSANLEEGGDDLRLTFSPTPNYIYSLDPSLVDMVRAPVDSDVTCVLYVTASASLTGHSVTTCCRVLMEPVPELSAETSGDILNGPIYNINYIVPEAVWSCSWNAKKMRIGLGMENYAMMVDVITERNFRLSSRHKNVLSQEFAPAGDLLYMGLKGDDVICCDLRLPSHHIVSSFAQANVGWLRLLKSDPNFLLAENFLGQVKMWDVRNRKALMSFSGHKNSHYRLSCLVDESEKLLFAVGDDGTTRGWSLKTAELLCEVPSPRPVQERADFPRVCFSDNWAGISGNAAVVLAVEDELRVHKLCM